MEGLFLQSAEAFSDSPFVGTAGEVWELLQAEKEHVSRDILAESDLCADESAPANEAEPSEESARAIEWHNRETLEERLREIKSFCANAIRRSKSIRCNRWNRRLCPLVTRLGIIGFRASQTSSFLRSCNSTGLARLSVFMMAMRS